MKNNRHSTSKGSVLIAAAVSAAILAILTVGFLTYLTSESNLNYRGHRWNQAFHLAEGAVEVGLAELNYQYTRGGSGVGFQSANGWNSPGPNTYRKTVTNLTDSRGQVVGSFQVTAVITAIDATRTNAQFTGVGTVTSGNFGGQDISRAVRVNVVPSSAFPVGLMSKNRIDLNGQHAYTDSFDSSDLNKSTNGAYDPNKKQPHGDIATDSTVIDSIGLGNADIYGTASTGPGGTVTMGPNASLGPTFGPPDASRATTVADAVSAGWIRSDFNTDVPNPSPPTGPASSGSISDDYIINNSGSYTFNSISLAGNKTLMITNNAVVTLYVVGDTSLTGNGQITIAPGSSLTVYAYGSISLGGNGVQNNSTYARNDVWYGVLSTSVSVAGNGSFTGAIYAPNADLTISGNGNLYGAIVAKSITLNGNAHLHYDESLKNFRPPWIGYLAASWQELRNVGGSWVP
jgi:hypothetical protein